MAVDRFGGGEPGAPNFLPPGPQHITAGPRASVMNATTCDHDELPSHDHEQDHLHGVGSMPLASRLMTDDILNVQDLRLLTKLQDDLELLTKLRNVVATGEVPQVKRILLTSSSSA